MSEPLPKFRYHPDPLSTGSIVESDERCQCCGKKRGYVLTSTIYSQEHVDFICPWCVADGSASEKFHGEFVPLDLFEPDELSESIIEEVAHRTPSFDSWQEEQWLFHCSDACQFLGAATLDDLKALSKDEISEAVDMDYFPPHFENENDWNELLHYYEPGGDPSIFKFGCLHCGKKLYYMDFS